MLTPGEADSRKLAACSQIAGTIEPAWQRIVATFQELLEAELAITIGKAAKTQSGVYIRQTPYVDCWNSIGSLLIQRGYHERAALLFAHSLTRERELEVQHSIHMHKGYSYHNLGLSQVMQGNWPEGIENIRRAAMDDVSSGWKEQDTHAYKVSEQLAVPERELLANRLLTVLTTNGYTADPEVLRELFGSFTLEIRLRVTFTLRTARTAGDETDFGRTMRFDALRDVCHLYEAWLHARGYHGNGVKPSLDGAYGGCGQAWWSAICANWSSLAKAEKTCEAEACLQNILGAFPNAAKHDLLAKSHLLTGLMRNWTAHQFDPDASFLSDSLYMDAYLAPWVCFYHAKAEGK